MAVGVSAPPAESPASRSRAARGRRLPGADGGMDASALAYLELEQQQQLEEEDEPSQEAGTQEEEEDDDDIDGTRALARSVVQVFTRHRVPNFMRPWEEGHEALSTSSAFVVRPAPGRPPLLVTTAGAVEHAKKVPGVGWGVGGGGGEHREGP